MQFIPYCNKTLQSDWSVRGVQKSLLPPLIQLIPLLFECAMGGASTSKCTYVRVMTAQLPRYGEEAAVTVPVRTLLATYVASYVAWFVNALASYSNTG